MSRGMQIHAKEFAYFQYMAPGLAEFSAYDATYLGLMNSYSADDILNDIFLELFPMLKRLL